LRDILKNGDTNPERNSCRDPAGRYVALSTHSRKVKRSWLIENPGLSDHSVSASSASPPSPNPSLRFFPNAPPSFPLPEPALPIASMDEKAAMPTMIPSEGRMVDTQMVTKSLVTAVLGRRSPYPTEVT